MPDWARWRRWKHSPSKRAAARRQDIAGVTHHREWEFRMDAILDRVPATVWDRLRGERPRGAEKP